MAITRHRVLQPGDEAPDFSLVDQNGQRITLSVYHGVRSVVLAFYIRAFTGL